jgi:hypothetical protein
VEECSVFVVVQFDWCEWNLGQRDSKIHSLETKLGANRTYTLTD